MWVIAYGTKVLWKVEQSLLGPWIEKSENVADISKKYRISDGAETIIVTDGKIDKKSAKSLIYRRNIGEAPIYRKISRYFPTSPARAQDTKSGSKIVDLGFVKFKSNGTTTKRPLKQIQKTQGAKEKQIFWFSLGVLNGFSRKSNENEFSRKSNGGWIFLGIKRGLQKK